LYLGATSVSSLEVISTLTLLRRLSLSSTQIDAADLASLGTLTQLLELDVDGNGLTSLATIPRKSSLEYLGATRNPLADHAQLAAFTSIQELFIDETGAVDGDLAHLQGLSELRHLGLGRNAITNLLPLTTLPSLENASVSDNPLSATSCCTHIPTLEQAGVSVYAGAACNAHPCQ
jgi:Leucine-rich repeat (LRR) protein